MDDLIAHFVRVRPRDISYVKFVFEAHEVVGFLRTVDRTEAILVVLVVPDFAAEGEAILDSIAREIPLERISLPTRLGDDWLLTTLWPEAGRSR